MLNNEGVEVECANSGANGLTKILVQHRRYDGIILDVRLPDMSGLHVLEILAERHIRSPVLMLTGYPDLDGAVRAIKLGAWDYKPKTVLLDDAWIDVVKALVRQGRSDDHCDSHVWNVTSGRPRTHSGWAQTIANAVDAERQSPGLVTSVLAVAIADRALAPQVVLTCARAFRQAVTDGDQRVVSVLAASVIDACARVHQTQTPQSRASQILETLERGLQNHRRLSASEIAGAVGTHPTSVGRWLRGDTGVPFDEWRRLLAARALAFRLYESDERVSQIAYDIGYEHPNQAAREFRATFGVSPRRYRELCRQAVVLLGKAQEG